MGRVPTGDPRPVRFKLELKIADVFDSHANRRAAEAVPAGRPGRGITAEGLHSLSALPRADGKADATNVPEGIEALVTKIRESWNGPQAPAVRLLPAELPYDALKADEYTNKWHIPIGIAESNLKPVYLELDNDPHFMYLSDVETGKSNFLRVLIKTIVSRCTSKEAQFVLFDYRRSLLGAVPPNYLVKHCSTSEQSMEMVKALIAAAKSRAAPDDVTPQQLRDRSWWSGPEMFAIIDDFDLVSSGFQNPLQPLMEVVPQGRDTGLHVIITRRTGGAGRDLYGQVLGRMKDLATPGFQGSGPRAEGKLLGDIKASEDASRPRLACGPSPRKPQDPGRLDTTGDLAWTGVPSYRRPRRRIRFHSLEDQQRASGVRFTGYCSIGAQNPVTAARTGTRRRGLWYDRGRRSHRRAAGTALVRDGGLAGKRQGDRGGVGPIRSGVPTCAVQRGTRSKTRRATPTPLTDEVSPERLPHGRCRPDR